jgi:SAM-dependent methyltransferase
LRAIKDDTAPVREQWGEVAKYWSDSRRDNLWRQHADAVNARLVERWLSRIPVERLLKTDLFDEAVTGGLHSLLMSRARLVVGMDISGVVTQLARSNCEEMVVACADVRSLPFADDAFDVVLSNSTLDHFATRQEVVASLRELNRVTRPGGKLVLTLDNRGNPAVALRNMLPLQWLQRLKIVPYFVGVNCGPRGLRRLLEETSWELLEMDSILHCPRFLMVGASRFLTRRGSCEAQKRFLAWLARFEGLAHWPTRYLTGYFVAARARKRGSGKATCVASASD